LTLRAFAAVAVLAILCAAAGCVTPVAGAPDFGGRTGLHQLGIAKAAKEALKRPKFEALRGMKVALDIACISRGPCKNGVSEDEHFLKNVITESLVENGVVVVEKQEAKAVLRGICEAIGTDTVTRVFPHMYLPLAYRISNTARVKIHLYAYDVQDSQPIAVDDCEGTYSWGEWSVLGLGPFR